jgi:hypothetical protein
MKLYRINKVLFKATRVWNKSALISLGGRSVVQFRHLAELLKSGFND